MLLTGCGPGGGGAPPTPTERITNGNFADSSVWTAPSGGWTIAAGVATNTAALAPIRQLFVSGQVALGLSYTLTYEIVANPNGTGFGFRFVDAAGVVTGAPVIPPETIGSVEYIGSAPANAFGIRFMAEDDPGVVLDNVSLIA